MNTIDIAFYLLTLVGASWLLWELIPDSTKQYWKYTRELRRDKKEGRRRKYSFTWRHGGGR